MYKGKKQTFKKLQEHPYEHLHHRKKENEAEGSNKRIYNSLPK